MGKLINKVALVTGGSRGMGAAIALRLAKEGAHVALTYKNSEAKAQSVIKNIEQLDRRGLAIHADSADPEQVRSAVDAVISAFGRIDILVNNAGIFDVKPLEAITLEDYEKTLDINVRAVVFASQAAAKHMKAGGRIISIGSNLAERVPMGGLSLYSLSKAALIGFTKGIARDLGPQGITANVVHPGSTDTDMNPANGPFSDNQRGAMCIPRYAEPDDIAGLVVWLASEDGRCMTGAGLTIDGGTNA